MRSFFVTVLIILLALFGVYYYAGETLGLKKSVLTKPTINVSSQEFGTGEKIPFKYTCDGEDVNPPLVLDRVPSDAKSLVLIVDDRTSVSQSFNHWIVFNIDPSTTNIEENKIPNALLGTNDFKELKYKGPCPEIGVHKYYFKILALDITLPDKEGLSRQDIDKLIKGHIMAIGETYGIYEK